MDFRSLLALNAALPKILASPRDDGTVDLIVARPAVDERATPDAAQLDVDAGMVGDNWGRRSKVQAEAQIAIMNRRVIEAIAGSKEGWPPAGDQLFVDFDLSVENLRVGQRLAVGEAELVITQKLHQGCKKFSTRYGPDALKFVNSRPRLRGVYAQVVKSGMVRLSDRVGKIEG